MSEAVANSAPVVEASAAPISNESIEASDLDLGDEPASEEASSEAKKEEIKEVKDEKKRLKKLKLKFNGKEIEEELPFEIDDDPKVVEYMQKQLQLAKLGNSKAQEYANLEKTVANFINELKTNPKKALSNPNIGVDIKRLAAEVLEEEIANSQKSPEQIEREKMEAELKAMKEEREKEKEESRQRELARLQEQELTRYDQLFTQAIETSGLPKSPYVVKKMADVMIDAIQQGHNVDVKDIVPFVKNEIMQDIQQMFEVMPAEVLKEFIGKGNFDKIRKHNMSKAKVKPPVTTNTIAKDTGVNDTPKSKEEKKGYKEFFGGIF